MAYRIVQRRLMPVDRLELQQLLLESLMKVELRRVYDLLGLRYLKSWGKSMLAMGIEYHLLRDPKRLEQCLPLSAVVELKSLIVAGGKLPMHEPMVFYSLFRMGLVSISKGKDDKEECCYLPENLRLALEPVIDGMVENESLKAWDEKERYLCGILNVYGVVEMDFFYELYRRISGDSVDKRGFLRYFFIRERLFNGIHSLKLDASTIGFCHDEVSEPKELYKAVLSRDDLSYKHLEPDIFWEMGDAYWWPRHKGAEKLMELLKTKLKDGFVAWMLLHDSWMLLQNDISTVELTKHLLSDKRLNWDGLEEVNAFMAVFMTFLNNIPQWSLKGYSPAELFEVERKFLRPLPKEPFDLSRYAEGDTVAEPRNEVAFKVGRNDPCPCGSGKKYKKCCGK